MITCHSHHAARLPPAHAAPRLQGRLLLGTMLLCAFSLLPCLAQDPAPLPDSQRKMVLGPLEFYSPAPAGPREHQVVVGRDVFIPAGQTNHDLVVLLGNVKIEGTVTGHLTVILGRLEVEQTGHVHRKAVLMGGQPDVHPEAVFSGFKGPTLLMPAWLSQGLQHWMKKGILLGRPLPHDLVWAWWIISALLCLNLLVGLLLPRPLEHCARVLAQRPLSCFFVGMVVCLLLGPLMFVLVVSVVGAPSLPIMACLFMAALLLGKLAVYRYAGEQLADQLGAPVLQHHLWPLLVGLVLFTLLYMIPILGLTVLGWVVMMAVGTSVLSCFMGLKREIPKAAPAGIPLIASSPADAMYPEKKPAQPLLLDRAGFWLRLAAVLVDLLLVGVVVRGLAGTNAGESFLPVFVLYHLGMWAWKGTTVGGLVVGLRIVLSSGRPLTFAAALVRWLGAFLSAMVLGLGFFWAGWSKEKQSWHDLLAGTAVVRMPRTLLTRTFSET